MLNHVCVLLVLGVGSVGLNNAVDTVDCTCDAVAGDELAAIPTKSQPDMALIMNSTKAYRSK